jgi:hypothetical protein
MTKTQIERLAVLEQKVSDIDSKIDRNFLESQNFHKEILNQLKSLDERYPTRREFKAANWVFGIMITVLSLAIAFYANIIKG